MIVIGVITVLTAIILANENNDYNHPTQYEYGNAVIISTINLDKTEYKIGEKVQIKPELTNIGNETVTILHGDPPFLIDVYSSFGKMAWSFQSQDDIGQIAKLEPQVPYRWDEEKIQTRYDIRLYIPGEYKIVAHSEFVIQERGSEKLVIAKVYSKPVPIKIVP